MRAQLTEGAFLKDSARRLLAGAGRGRRRRYSGRRHEPQRLDLYVWLASLGLLASVACSLRRRFAADTPELAPET